jgi:hypothetical protein
MYSHDQVSTHSVSPEPLKHARHTHLPNHRQHLILPPPPTTTTPSFKEWDEDRKIEWLTEELATKRPLIPADMPMTDEVIG